MNQTVINRKIVVIAHNIRSVHNVGSIFRTCEGLGVFKLYLTGYSPYPGQKNDSRLPHLVKKIEKDLNKTALGAEYLMRWQRTEDIMQLINDLRKNKFTVTALEQNSKSQNIVGYNAPANIAIILGNEVDGVENGVLKIVDAILEIPMLGKKESFNVAQAGAIAIYALRYT